MQNINDKESKKHQLKSQLRKSLKNIGQIFKNIFSSRIFIALIFLFVGSVATHSCTSKNSHKKHYHYHHSFFEDDDDDFFNSHDDFFAEFDLMHKRMENAMKHHRKMMQKAFEENHKSGTNIMQVQASLQHTQDEKFHNFELQFSGIKPEDISVVVEKNYLVFSSKKAEISATKSDEKSTQASSSADFYYATYLPEYDEKIAPEIIKNNDKIVVKLTKDLSIKNDNKIKNGYKEKIKKIKK